MFKSILRGVGIFAIVIPWWILGRELGQGLLYISLGGLMTLGVAAMALSIWMEEA